METKRIETTFFGTTTGTITIDQISNPLLRRMARVGQVVGLYKLSDGGTDWFIDCGDCCLRYSDDYCEEVPSIVMQYFKGELYEVVAQ